MNKRYQPRPHQNQILNYSGGWMGVSAVPGSGKTYTLSLLAAQIITSGQINEDQEVLIVTLVNSAVDNFASRIGAFVEEFGLMRDMNYRVRTLHGLAHDIVRERPDLAGLSDRFNIADERDSDEIIQTAVSGWMRSHPEFILEWSNPNSDPKRNSDLPKKWEDLLVKLARAFIRQAKDLQLTPQQIRDQLGKTHYHHSLLQFGLDIYDTYQRGLVLRSLIDFDDLIRLALNVLNSDPDYLQRLRFRFPFILEDEAQDSSRLQEEILRRLAGENGNWVRVGDPNQAIYETFTTASPEYLRRFLELNSVRAYDLPDSGRSTLSIIRLANELIRWTIHDHPVEALRNALTPPYIRPTPAGDPQPNPPDEPNEIYLIKKKFSSDGEIKAVVDSLKRWLPEHSDQTVAVLVPRNERGSKVVNALKAAGLPVIELLQSSQTTRQTAAILEKILKSLNKAADPRILVEAFKEVIPLVYTANAPEKEVIHQAAQLLLTNSQPENYLYPRSENNWLEELHHRDNLYEQVIPMLEVFALRMRRWQQAILLPIDQLILTIAQDIFRQPTQLALAHSLALLLGRTAQRHPEWQLSQFVEELGLIARNERRILGFSEEEPGFDPDLQPGKVVVATIHKAKGLEWDRVYLMSVNNYDFPSAQGFDRYYSEKYFVRNQLNLEAEALNLLKALASQELTSLYLEEGIATQQARLEYCAERLRLLYVGITRARRSIVITWNTGKEMQGNENSPALPFVHLQKFWEEYRRENST
ncbi:MAG: DNA helicase [Bellilinea sp.]|nr:MAG: DNA helicase [Bellilinea sp.]